MAMVWPLPGHEPTSPRALSPRIRNPSFSFFHLPPLLSLSSCSACATPIQSRAPGTDVRRTEDSPRRLRQCVCALRRPDSGCCLRRPTADCARFPVCWLRTDRRSRFRLPGRPGLALVSPVPTFLGETEIQAKPTIAAPGPRTVQTKTQSCC